MNFEVGDLISTRAGNEGKVYATKSGVPEIGDVVLLNQENAGNYSVHKSGVPDIGDNILLTTGQDGKLYALISGGRSCNIWLHRIALVYNSSSLSPPEASIVYYADSFPLKQCGYLYSGNFTSIFALRPLSGGYPQMIANVEIRLCKINARRLVFETYGEYAPDTDISLWFMRGTQLFSGTPDFISTLDCSSNPNYPAADAGDMFYVSGAGKVGGVDFGVSVGMNDVLICCIDGSESGDQNTVGKNWCIWSKLNSSELGVTMPYATISFSFKEVNEENSTTINCCKECPDCYCANCEIANRFKIISPRGIVIGSSDLYYQVVNKYGAYALLFENAIIEYTLSESEIQIWIYYDQDLVEYNELIEVYYYDDDETWNLMYSGLSEGLL